MDTIKISNLEKEVIEAAKMAKAESSKTTSLDDSMASNTSTSSGNVFSRVKSNQPSEHTRQAQNNGFPQNEKIEHDRYTNRPSYAFKFGITKKGVSSDYPNDNANDVQSPVINNNSIPPYIQRNLRKLISSNPDGVWCAELPLIYRYSNVIL